MHRISRSLRRRGLFAATLGASLLGIILLAAPVRGAVTEPNGLQVPVLATGDANYVAHNNTALGLQFVSLESLFKSRGENIGWQADAVADPGTFSPLCDFTGTMVLRGGGCILDFCWYNAVQSGGSPPADSELYTLVPGASLVGEFNPLVGDPPQQRFSAANIRNDPHYKGGLIGFAIRGASNTNCTQTHYSQRELNVVCSDTTVCPKPGPWVTSLTWQSTAYPDSFYISFEDLAVSPNSFAPPSGQLTNDGDFNDFTYFVSGVACDGGGDVCDTGKPGVCSIGRTACGGGDCKPVYAPSPEVCDNVDNDCNGIVDDKAPCPNGEVCSKGVCVPPCGSVEFPCTGGEKCKDGVCVEAACATVDCPAGKVCRGGQCTDACTGVTCPAGQECQLGRCRDLCAGVKCDSGTVCDRGICVSGCQCKPCKTGFTCQSDGRCLDEACANKTCASGLVCKLGQCVDPCAGVKCPGGAACVAGVCQEPTGNGGSGNGNNGGSGAALSNTGGGFVAGGAPAGGGVNDGSRVSAAPTGCACHVAESSGGTPLIAFGLALGALGLIIGRRRD